MSDPDLIFNITMRCESDAFAGYPPLELTRVLHRVAERIDAVVSPDGRHAEGSVFDVNGADLGSFVLSDAVPHPMHDGAWDLARRLVASARVAPEPDRDAYISGVLDLLSGMTGVEVADIREGFEFSRPR